MLSATFETALQREVCSFIGTADEVRRTSNAFFSSVHHRLPIISESRFHKNLPRLFTPSGLDFTTLCMCMKLVLTNPSRQAIGEIDAASPHYLLAKSSISSLEAVGFISLNAIQARLLLVLYELGHGIFPAASISIGGCARLARNAGLSRDFWQSQKAASTTADAEERKRTWWALHNLDRYFFPSVPPKNGASTSKSIDDNSYRLQQIYCSLRGRCDTRFRRRYTSHLFAFRL
jgi:hypothetical protein